MGGGGFIGGPTNASPKSMGVHLSTNPFQGINFSSKILMIFSYFNFLKGLKMMFKHCLGVLERPIKFPTMGGGVIKFSPKPLEKGHIFQQNY